MTDSKRPPLRIAVVGVHSCPFRPTGELNSGGMNVYLKEMTRHMSQIAAHIDIFTMTHPGALPPVENILPNVRIIHLAGIPQDVSKNDLYQHLPTFTDALLKFTQNEQYDIVYSHYWLSTLPGAALAGADTPHFVAFHTLDQVKQHHLPISNEHPMRFATEQEAARNATALIAWSRHEKEALAEIYGADADKIHIVPPGVDTGLFSSIGRADARAKLGIGDELVVAYVGRLDEIKGIPLLIDAFAEIPDRVGGRPHQLHIIGAGQNEAETALVKSHLEAKLSPQAFKMWGSVKHAELPMHYAAADIFATATYYESFGMAALEAAASAVPIVASGVGGLRITVIDNYNGHTIEPHNRAQYTLYIEKLLADQKLRQHLGQNGREHAQSFHWERIVARLNDKFHKVRCRKMALCSGTI